eukprot:jgi/Picsp_1/1039/NSC_04523-R1_---NA---
MEEEADIFTFEDYMRGMTIPAKQVEVEFDQSWLEPGTDNGVRQVVQFIKALRRIEHLPDEEKIYEDHLKRVDRRDDAAKANSVEEQDKVKEQNKVVQEGKHVMQIGSNVWSTDKDRHNTESASENKFPADQQPSTILAVREDQNKSKRGDVSGKHETEEAITHRNPFDGLPEKFDTIKKSFEAQKLPVRKKDDSNHIDNGEMTEGEINNPGRLEKQKEIHEDAQKIHQEDERHSVHKEAIADVNGASNLAVANDLRSNYPMDGVIQTQDVGHAEILDRQKTLLDSPELKEKLHQVQEEQYRRDLIAIKGAASPQITNEKPMERQEVYGASAEETPQNTPREGIPSLQNRNHPKSTEQNHQNENSSFTQRNIHPTLTPAMLAARERIQGIQRKLKRRHQEINASSSDPV